MNIRPTQTGLGSTYGPAGPRRSAGDDQARKATPDVPAARPASDQVEVSETAMKLAAQHTGRVVGSIPNERMRTVLARIAGGYYDRPEVRDQILDRLASDLDRDI
jgi:hypothetical protein